MKTSYLKMSVMLLILAGLTTFTLKAFANGTAPAEPEESQALKFLKNTEIHGTVDTIYNFNLNRPPRADTNGNAAGDTSANMLRAFDTDPNSLSLNLVELAIQSQPVDWASFRFDLDFGRDTRVYQAFGFNDELTAPFGDNFELQQGYIYLTAKGIGNGMNFKIGKFVTLHGAEVIESAVNNNTSRGLLFTWAIPFTHTGVLMDYTFNDYWAINLGVVNGWDNVLDNNDMKTAHAAIIINPVPDKFSMWIGGSFGPEQDDNNSDMRTLVDIGFIWNAHEKLAFTLNLDGARESGLGGDEFLNWWGAAAYAHWKATDLFGLTFRGEYFVEELVGGAGFRTGLAGGTIWEGTLTSHLYLFEGFDLRFEGRVDHSGASDFVKDDGSTTEWQPTILAEAVYSF